MSTDKRSPIPDRQYLIQFRHAVVEKLESLIPTNPLARVILILMTTFSGVMFIIQLFGSSPDTTRTPQALAAIVVDNLTGNPEDPTSTYDNNQALIHALSLVIQNPEIAVSSEPYGISTEGMTPEQVSINRNIGRLLEYMSRAPAEHTNADTGYWNTTNYFTGKGNQILSLLEGMTMRRQHIAVNSSENPLTPIAVEELMTIFNQSHEYEINVTRINDSLYMNIRSDEFIDLDSIEINGNVVNVNPLQLAFNNNYAGLMEPEFLDLALPTIFPNYNDATYFHTSFSQLMTFTIPGQELTRAQMEDLARLARFTPEAHAYTDSTWGIVVGGFIFMSDDPGNEYYHLTNMLVNIGYDQQNGRNGSIYLWDLPELFEILEIE